VRHYRVDETHSNSWTAWKRMGSPQQPETAQYAELEAAGQLQELDSPRWAGVHDHTLKLNFPLPLSAVSLIQVEW